MACWFTYLEMFTGRVLTLRNCPFQFESAWFIYNTCIIIRQLAISFSVFFVSCPNFVLQLAISFSGSFLYYLGLELATCYFVFRLFLYLPPTFFCFFLAVKITYCKKCLVFTTVVSEKMLMGPIESSPMTKGVWCHAQNLFGNILRTYLRV